MAYQCPGFVLISIIGRLGIPSYRERNAMRRIDAYTRPFFARPWASYLLAEESARALNCSADSEAHEDAIEEAISSWETAWIDLGGEA